MKIFASILAIVISVIPQTSVEALIEEKSPELRKETEFAHYIKDCHSAMNRLLPALGQKPTRYPLPWTRAKYYSFRLIDEINRRELGEDFLWRFIVPYIDQGTGFINGLNDEDLKKPSIGIFEIRPDTARWLVYRCHVAMKRRLAGKPTKLPEGLIGKHADKVGWSDARWIEFLIYEFKEAGSDDGISFGFDLLQTYYYDYDGDPDMIFHALVAGPKGAARGVEVNFSNFHDRQRKARKFHNFVTGEA